MDYNFLAQTILFRGTSPDQVQSMLECLSAEERHYSKGKVIYHAGDITQSMGMVISGSVYIENNDFWGNRSVLDSVGPGQVFAETYSCVPGEPLMVSVLAAEETTILFLNTGRLLDTCSSTCPHHSKIIRNLLTISAQKNLNLSRRIFHTSPKSIKGKLLSYLSFQAARQGSYDFSIPFNRQQLADYLGVDRSALSNEISKMQKEGLLKTNRNRFLLIEDPYKVE